MVGARSAQFTQCCGPRKGQGQFAAETTGGEIAQFHQLSCLGGGECADSFWVHDRETITPSDARAAGRDQTDVRPPTNVGATGLPLNLIEDILMRTVVAAGQATTLEVAERMHCSSPIIDSVVQSLRDRGLIEYRGMVGLSYVLAATDAGGHYSIRRSTECRYVGPLPVPLEQYSPVVRAQTPQLFLNQDKLTRAFSDLVISPELIDQLGPAICGDGAIFLYGPPGTGKSSIAERLIRAYEDTVLIPYCLEVQGQIITVFDPVTHEPVAEQPRDIDRRWVLCQRPAVIAGGELHLGMLDLALDADVGTYSAPLQLKANNGIFVIDDFGRQAMTPEQMLNRWIIPLDRQVDYLTLIGRKFQVPFEVKVTLSTNLSPEALGDEAFFRRIHNKVYIGCMTDQQFDWVLARVAKAKKIGVTADAAVRLRQVTRGHGDGELRAYLPGVVCKLATAICRYEGIPVRLTPELVDRVLDLYFAKTDSPAAPAQAPERAHVEKRPKAMGPVAAAPPLPMTTADLPPELASKQAAV